MVRFKDKTWVKATVMYYSAIAWVGLGITWGLLGWYIMFGLWIAISVLVAVPALFYITYKGR